MTTSIRWTRRSGFVSGICVAMAALADWFFYGHPLGWTLAAFALITAILVMSSSKTLWKSWTGGLLALLVVVLLLAMAEEPSPLTVWMSIVGLGMLVMLADEPTAAQFRQSLKATIGQWVLRWIALGATLWLRWLLDGIVGSRWLKRHPRLARQNWFMTTINVIAWWTLPVLAGLVFFGLFAIANPIVESWVTTAWNKLATIFDWLPLYLRVDRMFLWIFVGLTVYGLLRYRALGQIKHSASVPANAAPADHWFTGEQMIVRCLIVFNLVFAMESVLDCIYLFGGHHLPEGMSYKTYAHRGAYPLIATALLAGLFVLITFRTGGAAQRSAWARRLVYLWIGQNLLLMASTIWRLWLYVDVDGLTRLRVATMIWLVLVGSGFAWIVVKILRGLSNSWLWRMNVITTLIVLYACAFINFDGLIAQYNVTHCLETTGQGGSIDIAYLRELGPESLPALAWLREHDAADRGNIDQAAVELRSELSAELSDWRGWTYRRWREAPIDMRQNVVNAYASR